jgi:hypothetical protein
MAVEGENSAAMSSVSADAERAFAVPEWPELEARILAGRMSEGDVVALFNDGRVLHSVRQSGDFENETMQVARTAPHAYARRIRKARDKAVAAVSEPSRRLDGRPSAELLFGFGDHVYFRHMINQMVTAGPVTARMMAVIMNRIAAAIGPF